MQPRMGYSGTHGKGQESRIIRDIPDLTGPGRYRAGRALNPVSVAELAEAWLTSKRANESAEQAEKGNSDRARRADLGRWALLIAEAVGRSPADDDSPINGLDLDDLSEDVLAAATAASKRRWSDATSARMLSTLRSFSRWLYRTGRITTDPLEGDVFRGPPRRERRPKALGEEDVERIHRALREQRHRRADGAVLRTVFCSNPPQSPRLCPPPRRAAATPLVVHEFPVSGEAFAYADCAGRAGARRHGRDRRPPLSVIRLPSGGLRAGADALPPPGRRPPEGLTATSPQSRP